DFRFLRIVTVIPRGSDNSFALRVYHNKRSARFERTFEENFEYVFLVAITLRMLFPDQRVRRDSKKIVPIFWGKRAKFDQFTFQMWLKVKKHSGSPAQFNRESRE